ncbi:unnamed protein product [Pleuronectes platessa]|uniref:Death-associated protein 1 n=1 Tax=Pleuronectes platessa TaxID=8262 RepID=A0A9N7VTN9_PLEPL|nr:unnamed protein product [Pleuronectes platessa]
MSSPPKEKEKVETKGGHPPAVKAGGMRIVQKHQTAAIPEPLPKQEEEEDDEEYVTISPPKAPVIVSGVVTKKIALISVRWQASHLSPLILLLPSHLPPYHCHQTQRQAVHKASEKPPRS